MFFLALCIMPSIMFQWVRKGISACIIVSVVLLLPGAIVADVCYQLCRRYGFSTRHSRFLSIFCACCLYLGLLSAAAQVWGIRLGPVAAAAIEGSSNETTLYEAHFVQTLHPWSSLKNFVRLTFYLMVTCATLVYHMSLIFIQFPVVSSLVFILAAI